MINRMHFQSLASLVSAMREGKLSALEVTEHHLTRIAFLEPNFHAFAYLRADVARAEAKELDAKRARGEVLGPLHGAPIAVKDLCAMAGTPTRAGGFFPTGFAAGETATIVRRLQAAGAIVIGKAQLTEGAWGTHHPDVPVPVSPWAPHRWSGSSSSGSGVAVAAGFAAGAIGTDTAGSIRYPSACNGLVGLKPTWGRVSRHGVFPLSDTFDHVGPMARSVLDAAMIFAAIAGQDTADPTALLAPAEPWTQAASTPSLKGVRIGLDLAFATSMLDEPTSHSFKTALDTMISAGATIVEVHLPPVDPILERAVAACFAEAAISHAATYPSQKEKYSPLYAELLEIGRAMNALDYAAVTIWRGEFAGHLAALFQTIDMLAVPVLPVAPPLTQHMVAVAGGSPLAAAGLLRFTLPFNLASVPSLTLPMSRMPDQTPLGFQLIGPALGERALLAAGAAYEAAAGYLGQNPDI